MPTEACKTMIKKQPSNKIQTITVRPMNDNEKKLCSERPSRWGRRPDSWRVIAVWDDSHHKNKNHLKKIWPSLRKKKESKRKTRTRKNVTKRERKKERKIDGKKKAKYNWGER